MCHILCVCVNRSEVIWEEHRKGKHWKPVELLLGNTLDQLYIQGANEVVEIPGSDLSVDFTNRKKVILHYAIF